MIAVMYLLLRLRRRERLTSAIWVRAEATASSRHAAAASHVTVTRPGTWHRCSRSVSPNPLQCDTPCGGFSAPGSELGAPQQSSEAKQRDTHACMG